MMTCRTSVACRPRMSCISLSKEWSRLIRKWRRNQVLINFCNLNFSTYPLLFIILVLQCNMGFKLCLPQSRDHQMLHYIFVYFSCYKLFNNKFIVVVTFCKHPQYTIHNIESIGFIRFFRKHPLHSLT